MYEALKAVLVLISLARASSLISRDAGHAQWRSFLTTFNKTYESYEEHKYRLNIFLKNIHTIEIHNAAADRGLHSYWLGVNQMADWTDEEYEERLLGFGLDVNLESYIRVSNQEHNMSMLSLPKEVDWRQTNCVTGVKYQGHCGSCYAFASTGAMETQHCLKTGQLISLSEQNLVDCTYNSKYNNRGCIGGLMDRAYRYIIDNGGIDTEESYPYRADVGSCRFNPDTVGATASNYHDIVPRGDEFQLKKAVASSGPVSVGVDARGYAFKLYSYGVYNGEMCSSTKVNHGMLVIGYGTSDRGEDYWLIKNSWSVLWGENGYMKMIRNQGNKCGVASIASYPII